MKTTQAIQDHSILQLSRPARARRCVLLALPCLVALGMLAPRLHAGVLYLDFAKTGATAGTGYATGWNPIFADQQANTQITASNVGNTGYGFSFANVASYDNGNATMPLTRSGFYTFGGSSNSHAFTVTGLNASLPVKLYACAAWDGNDAAGYIVYGDNAPAGVRAQTVGTPGTSPTLEHLTYIGTATADGTGMVTGALYGRDGIAADYTEGQVGGMVFIPTMTITASAGAYGAISSSGVTNVYANETPTYTITPESGYHVTDVLVNGASVGAVTSYTFSSGIAVNSTIAASFAVDTASYTITASAGANGGISPSGAVVAFGGTNLPFTITPNTGYHVADVLVDGSSVGAVTSYTFNSIAADHSISASFAINTYTLTASAGGNGSISPNGVTPVNYDGSQSFTFTPAEGYYVADVLVDGVAVAAVPGAVASSYTITNVTAAHSITANFDNRTRLCLDFAGTGNPTSPNWIPVYANSLADTMVNVSNVGGSGHGFTFDHVATYNNGSIPLTQSGFYNIGGATYTHPFTLTGLIPGQLVSLYACAAWDGNGNGAYVVYGNSGASGVKAQTQGTPNTLPALANLTLIGTAMVDVTGKVAGSMYGSNGVAGSNDGGQVGGFVFAIEPPPTWTITASAGSHGTITPNGPVSVTSGTSQGFTIAADSGYQIADVQVDGNTVGAVGSYEFPAVVANHTITASFVASSVSYTITASAGGNGSISPSGAVSVNQGVNKVFSITPNTGCHIAELLVDGSPVIPPPASYTFYAVTGNHSISASFAIDTYTISASAGTNGAISPNGPTTVNYDNSRNFTITPAPGYYVDYVLVDGVSVGSPGSYEFTHVTGNHSIAASFDNRTQLKLDFTQAAGSYASGWTPVHGNWVPTDTAAATATDIDGLGYGFSIGHVSCYDNGNSFEPLTRSGFYTVGNNANPHWFTLTGLITGQSVSLYACAAWDGNNRGATIVFGDSGISGVRAATIGGPGTHPLLSNLALIGKATADSDGTVAGSVHGYNGVNTNSEGQMGGFVFVLEPSGAVADADGDGMDDTWETTCFGDTSQTATGDFDNDGTDNLTEFRLGLIPNNGASVFAATRSAAGQLQWPSAEGVTFTIERSTTLAGNPWEVLEAAFPGTAGTASYTDSPPPAGKAFYRIGLNP